MEDVRSKARPAFAPVGACSTIRWSSWCSSSSAPSRLSAAAPICSDFFNTPFLAVRWHAEPNPFNGILSPTRGTAAGLGAVPSHAAVRGFPAAPADPIFQPVQPEYPAGTEPRTWCCKWAMSARRAIACWLRMTSMPRIRRPVSTSLRIANNESRQHVAVLRQLRRRADHLPKTINWSAFPLPIGRFAERFHLPNGGTSSRRTGPDDLNLLDFGPIRRPIAIPSTGAGTVVPRTAFRSSPISLPKTRSRPPPTTRSRPGWKNASRTDCSCRRPIPSASRWTGPPASKRRSTLSTTKPAALSRCSIRRSASLSTITGIFPSPSTAASRESAGRLGHVGHHPVPERFPDSYSDAGR